MQIYCIFNFKNQYNTIITTEIVSLFKRANCSETTYVFSTMSHCGVWYLDFLMFLLQRLLLLSCVYKPDYVWVEMIAEIA